MVFHRGQIAPLAGFIALVTSFGSALAMDFAAYEKATKETLQVLASAKVDDVAKLIALQDQAIAIGVEGCKEYAIAHPEHAALMNLVIKSSAGMIGMKADELEAQWGDEGTAGNAIGIDFKKIGQFDPVRNQLDVVVHPARARAYFADYATSKKPQDLEEAKGELVEVLEHLQKLRAAAGK
jgi:hypothetical protein